MRVICPACGCHLDVAPAVPPGPVFCPDCSKRISLRPFVPAPPEPAEEAWLATRPTPPRRRPRRRQTWVVPSVTAVAVAAAVVCTAVVLSRPTSPTPAVTAVTPSVRDARQLDELRSMKRSADDLAAAGGAAVAFEAYGRVIAVADAEGVTDAVAAEVAAEARDGRDRVASAARAAASPPPSPPVASPPRPMGAVASTLAVDPASPASPTEVSLPDDPGEAVRRAADTAPPLATVPPSPRLHAYTLRDGISDAEIGRAIDRGVVYLRGRFRNGAVETGLAEPASGAPAAQPQPPGPAGPDDGDGPDRDRRGRRDGGGPPGFRREGPMGGGGGARWPRSGGRDFNVPAAAAYGTPGIDALCVYALLHAGQATSQAGLAVGDPFTDAVLTRLKGYQLYFTYHRSLRAAALAVYARPADQAALEEDVRWLTSAQRLGAYTYAMPAAAGSLATWDNSNSQYGLLGVWSGAQAGVGVGADYWRAVAQHWNGCVDRGSWGYRQSGGATLTMTCAGVASLLVAGDYLDDAGLLATTADRPSPNPAADAGLARLDTGDNCVAGLYHPDRMAMLGGTGYGLYGLERVGLASGFKYFGEHDWYAELARYLVDRQNANGSWGDGETSSVEVDTAYALLFLARGRHPILYNKLRYDGRWNDRPHDVAHLARYAAKQLERPLNWQVVNLRRDWSDWMDSPVLFISGEQPPTMSDHDYAALRDFALGGGLIFTHADGGSPAFTGWVQQLVRRVFPKYELMRVPKEHPLNGVLYKLKHPPQLEVVNNGSRILLVHSPTDVAGGWHLNWTDARAADFQLGLNVFVYAAGKTDYKNRLASTYIPAVPGPAEVTRHVARLRFAGEWDPEPYAWTRFARYFQWETRQALDVRTVDLKLLTAGQVPAAFLTGTVRQDFTPAEAAAARAFVAAGGVLVIDACGGQPAFVKSVRTTLLPAAFPGTTVGPLPPMHPLLLPSRPFADDLRQLPLRPFAAEQLGAATLPVEGLSFGRGWVVFSPLDLTTGLLGTQSWGILGYEPAHAQALVKHAILWADARSESHGR